MGEEEKNAPEEEVNDPSDFLEASKNIPREKVTWPDMTGRWPCRHNLACPEPSACNLCTGNCEPRVAFEAPTGDQGMSAFIWPQIFDVYPGELQVNDVFFVDGVGLYMDVFEKAREWKNGRWQYTDTSLELATLIIGKRDVPFDLTARPDAYRLAVIAQEWMNGPLRIHNRMFDLDDRFLKPLVVRPGPRGAVACTGTDPSATGAPGEMPFESGPHAAAFVDVHKPFRFTRIYYPSQCGGLRRPPAEGRYPLLAILHGNGTCPFNYDYLGRFLATWGYIVIAPKQTETGELTTILRLAMNNIGDLFAPLRDHQQKSSMVLFAHSRGADRAMEAIEIDGFGRSVAGMVFLAPYRPLQAVALPTLLIGASEDHQSLPEYVRTLFKQQKSKSHFVFIQGGNHSQFTDIHHWESQAGLDGTPAINRNYQFTIIQAYSLAFTQRVLKQVEQFPELLDGSQRPDNVVYSYK